MANSDWKLDPETEAEGSYIKYDNPKFGSVVGEPNGEWYHYAKIENGKYRKTHDTPFKTARAAQWHGETLGPGGIRDKFGRTPVEKNSIRNDYERMLKKPIGEAMKNTKTIKEASDGWNQVSDGEWEHPDLGRILQHDKPGKPAAYAHYEDSPFGIKTHKGTFDSIEKAKNHATKYANGTVGDMHEGITFSDRVLRLNESLIINEVEVDFSQYQNSHGKNPSGHGSWFLSPHKSVDFMKHREGDHYIITPGNTHIRDAIKMGKEWAKSKGYNRIYVNP